jgi:hypothetical protein
VRCPLCEALIDRWSKTVRDREGDTFPVCSADLRQHFRGYIETNYSPLD